MNPKTIEYRHTKFYLQIYSEFNRIFDKEMIQVIREIWEETKPKILEVAKNEQGSALKLLYEESISCVSEGIYKHDARKGSIFF